MAPPSLSIVLLIVHYTFRKVYFTITVPFMHVSVVVYEFCHKFKLFPACSTNPQSITVLVFHQRGDRTTGHYETTVITFMFIFILCFIRFIVTLICACITHPNLDSHFICAILVVSLVIKVL